MSTLTAAIPKMSKEKIKFKFNIVQLMGMILKILLPVGRYHSKPPNRHAKKVKRAVPGLLLKVLGFLFMGIFIHNSP